MPANSKGSRRRGRCQQCNVLTTMLLDYWPNGQGKRPRFKLCTACFEGVKAFSEVQQGKLSL